MNTDERVAILGGTFTPVHNGHRALLHKAFQTASHDGPGDGHVVVGLTSTDLAHNTRSEQLEPGELGTYEERMDRLGAELEHIARAYPASFEIIELTDSHGPAATREGLNALVVSPEAAAQRRAHEINTRRESAGLIPLEIHTPPFIVAEDGSRISATRIRHGEIDEHGRILDD